MDGNNTHTLYEYVEPSFSSSWTWEFKPVSSASLLNACSRREGAAVGWGGALLDPLTNSVLIYMQSTQFVLCADAGAQQLTAK